MSIILEGALDQELDEELGYSKYDYRNKETDNSRNCLLYTSIDTVEETDTKLREKIKQDLKHRLVIVNDDGETVVQYYSCLLYTSRCV